MSLFFKVFIYHLRRWLASYSYTICDMHIPANNLLLENQAP